MVEQAEQTKKDQVRVEDFWICPKRDLDSLGLEDRRQIESTLRSAKRIVNMADRLLSTGGLATDWNYKKGSGYTKSVNAENTLKKRGKKATQSISVKIFLGEDRQLESFDILVNEKGDVYHESCLIWKRILDGGLWLVRDNTPMM